MDLSTVVGASGVVATVVFSIASYRIGRRSEFAIADWMRELRQWSGRVVEELVAARYTLAAEEVSDKDIQAHARNISTLIECGRFYLPNQKGDRYGVRKPSAYRGFRHEALDTLVAVVRVLQGEVDEPLDEARVVWELQRDFLSKIVSILGPSHHNTTVSRMILASQISRRDDPTIGGLLPEDGVVPQGDDFSLHLAIERAKSYDE